MLYYKVILFSLDRDEHSYLIRLERCRFTNGSSRIIHYSIHYHSEISPFLIRSSSIRPLDEEDSYHVVNLQNSNSQPTRSMAVTDSLPSSSVTSRKSLQPSLEELFPLPSAIKEKGREHFLTYRYYHRVVSYKFYEGSNS